MQIAGIQIRRRIFTSAGLVVIAIGASLYWTRLNQPPLRPNPPSQPESFIKISGAGKGGEDKLLEERAEYFDPTPLFLPTNRNFQQGALPSRVVKQPGQVFRDFEPKLNFIESSLPEYGTANETGSSTLPEVLARGNDAPFAGFAALEQSGQPLAKRGGFIEVKALKNGVLSLAESLQDIEVPPVDYEPAEFIVSVASAGLVGDPMLVPTSGKEDVDGKLKDYLVNTYRIGERLTPGRYMIVIGP